MDEQDGKEYKQKTNSIVQFTWCCSFYSILLVWLKRALYTNLDTQKQKKHPLTRIHALIQKKECSPHTHTTIFHKHTKKEDFFLFVFMVFKSILFRLIRRLRLCLRFVCCVSVRFVCACKHRHTCSREFVCLLLLSGVCVWINPAFF